MILLCTAQACLAMFVRKEITREKKILQLGREFSILKSIFLNLLNKDTLRRISLFMHNYMEF